MIEVVIKQFLDEHLSVPSFFERPENPPIRYVLLAKTGSTKQNYLPSATFAFQSHAETMYEAAILNEEVKSVVEEMIETDEISSVKLNSDYNFTDTETKEYRYQAVFDITHYC